MAKNGARPRLHVEGPDDQHALIHLLIKNGVPYQRDSNGNDVSPSYLPVFEPIKGVVSLLEGIEPAIEFNTNRTVGFVLDADESLAERWKSTCSHLANVGFAKLPANPPAGGFIGDSATLKTRVGVWIMPDNVRDGKLEDFLRTLIQEDDSLIEHAEVSTNIARDKGASFTDNDEIKAIIHTWLAWQKEPGKPYGVAIRAEFFRHDSTAAAAFVAWFKELYQIPVSQLA